MTNFFYNLLIAFTALVPGGYVWVAVVLITVLLRLIFLKPSLDMVKIQHRQKELQPHVDKLREIHKDDKKTQQQAIMDLYKKEGFNPLSGCLPMIVQLVVLIGFYRIFTKIGLTGGVHADLLYSFTPRPDTVNTGFLGYDLAQTVVQLTKGGGLKGTLAFAFPAVTAATQLIQSLQARSLQPKPAAGKRGDFSQALTGQMTYLFPIMAGYISYTLNAALSIYWITQTVFMIVQQVVIVRRLQAARGGTQSAAPAAPARNASSIAGAGGPGAATAAVVDQIEAPKQTFRRKGVEVEVREKKRP